MEIWKHNGTLLFSAKLRRNFLSSNFVEICIFTMFVLLSIPTEVAYFVSCEGEEWKLIQASELLVHGTARES